MGCDLELEITSGGVPEAYAVAVDSPAGAAAGTVRLDTAGLLGRRRELAASVLASAVTTRAGLSVFERPVREVGQALFAGVFADRIYGRYTASVAEAARRGEPLRVVLRLRAPELAGLPWETLFDPEAGEYLCQREPVVRYVETAQPATPLPVDPPLRILGLVAAPRNLLALDVAEERRRLTDAVVELAGRQQVELVWAPGGSWPVLQQLLLAGPWHVLHFVGHGGTDPAGGGGLLALEDEASGQAGWVSARRFARLLHACRPVPRLVVLNSCQSGEVAADDLLSSTAAALVHSGISAAVAMQFAVTDPAALAFARGFYQALACNTPVDEAVRLGRIAIDGTGEQTLEWVTPVLYLRTDNTRLFTLTTPPRPPLPPPPPEPVRPGHAVDDPHYAEALAAFFAGRWEEAVDWFEALQARYPSDLHVQGWLATARGARDLASWSAEADAAAERADWAQAIAALERIIAVDHTYPEASCRLEQARTARRQSLLDEITALHRADRWQAVLAAGDELHRLDPDQPDPGGMLAEARQQLADDDLAARYTRALRLLDEGQRESAATLLAGIDQERPGYRDATALLAAAGGDPPTRVVAKSGGHHSSIGAAIAAAAAGDRILIKPGQYDEGLLLDKDLEILGDGPSEEIVLAAVDSAVVSIQAGTGCIGNLTIHQTGTQEEPSENTITAAVEIGGGQPRVQDCDISSAVGTGVLVRGNADPTVCGNRIHDNKRSGIFVYHQGRGTVEDNDIFGNASASVAVASGGDPTVRANRIHDGKGNGVYVCEQGRGMVEDNDIFGNASAGVAVASGGDPTVRANRIHDNEGNGVYVWKQGHGTVEDNDIYSNLDSGVEVRSRGTPTVRRNRIYDNKQGGVYVWKQGRGTVEDNDIYANPDSGVAVASGGDPTVRGNRIHDNEGNGVYVCEQSRGTVEDNDISDNTLTGVVVASGGDPTVRGNRIYGNAFSGVTVASGGDPTVRGNRIHDNKQDGVYVYNKGRGTVEDNDIYGNALPGVAVKSGGNPTVRGNRIHDGKSNGVYVYNKGRGTVEDNDIFGNAYAGVAVASGGTPTVRRNKIHNNQRRGVIVTGGGQGSIVDNEIFSNTPMNLKISWLATVTQGGNRIH